MAAWIKSRPKLDTVHK